MRKNIIDEYYINLANSGIKIPKEILKDMELKNDELIVLSYDAQNKEITIKKAPDTIII